MIRKLLSRAFPHRDAGLPSPLYQPSQPLCIVGDLHGRLDLLDAMFRLISEQPQAEAVRLVFVGDMIDRGLDSAAVLRRLRALCLEVPDRVICLAGNHERMLLDFLADPAGQGRRWIAAGGGETLASFGVGVGTRVEGATPGQRFAALAEALAEAMPPGLQDWIAELPLSWQEGNLAVVHAAADPARGLADQRAEVLQWGHPAFGKTSRSDGIWIAHGHTVVEAPLAEAGRIAVDTGAWRTGRLTAAWLDAEGLRFLQARA